MTNKTETNSENHNTLHIPSREEFHRRFGGRVYECDFNTEYNHSSSTGSKYAARIISDYRREDKLYREQLLMKGNKYETLEK